MNEQHSHTSSNSDVAAPEPELGPAQHLKYGGTSGSPSYEVLGNVTGSTMTTPMPDITNTEEPFKGDGGSRKTISKVLKGRGHEWESVPRRQGPLKLLDLPVDVLKEIVKEITHTNHLTALALTHSALHSLAIPHIYSRFDIVWPDATSTSDSRTGVDALTYGLSTLVMSHHLYEPEPTPAFRQSDDSSATNARPPRAAPRIRIGNNYSKYTTKFSLGNGPSDWVQDYMITKESGKMLGTLVSLAVARMVNLETFIWDMPTGVLRDVFLSLSSLEHKSPPGECRLERFLVRWHDNSPDTATLPASFQTNNTLTGATALPPNSGLAPIGIPFSSDNDEHPLHPQFSPATVSDPTRNPVECPTLSVLPPLKSLSVLDIDEVSYLDEMSILVEKSKDRLQELRIGISKKASEQPFAMAWDSIGLQQVDHDQTWPGASSKIGDRRLGGVLGIILGRVFDIRRPVRFKPRGEETTSEVAVPSPGDIPAFIGDSANSGNVQGQQNQQITEATESNLPFAELGIEADELTEVDQDQLAGAEIYPSKENDPLIDDVGDVELLVSSSITSPAAEISQLDLSQAAPQSPTSISKRAGASNKDSAQASVQETTVSKRKYLVGKLRLQVLELERVPLSIYVLQKAFDWTVLRSLTILDCAYHEKLWRMLHRQFRPQISPNSPKNALNPQMEYQLNLKHIHTDIATPPLISFLKETLAPNTLEVLFLQDRRRQTSSSVTIDAIYKGPLRRHRKSLKKLLIDSSDKIPRSPITSNESTRWRTWMLSHEAVAYVTSGNMSNLRELSVAIDYRDWHFFLRRLPNIPSLRSLNIPFIGDYVAPGYDPKELAMQVVDMIFLRPEIELCYLGISNKCFEILENRPLDDRHQGDEAHAEVSEQMTEDEEEDEDADSDEDDEDDNEDSDDDDGTATEAVEAEGAEYELSDDTDEFDDASEVDSKHDGNRLSLRLREILFYDDKVAIFKARHMRL